MSREIKFRAKRLDNNQLVIGYYLPTQYGEKHFIYFALEFLNEHTRIEIDPKTLGQYTGLLDKNGKEIYEGDVISVCYDGKYQNCWEAVVEWCKINPSFFLKKVNPPCISLNEYDFVKCELFELLVIGNIYANPELITEVKNV